MPERACRRAVALAAIALASSKYPFSGSTLDTVYVVDRCLEEAKLVSTFLCRNAEVTKVES